MLLFKLTTSFLIKKDQKHEFKKAEVQTPEGKPPTLIKKATLKIDNFAKILNATSKASLLYLIIVITRDLLIPFFIIFNYTRPLLQITPLLFGVIIQNTINIFARPFTKLSNLLQEFVNNAVDIFLVTMVFIIYIAGNSISLKAKYYYIGYPMIFSIVICLLAFFVATVTEFVDRICYVVSQFKDKKMKQPMPKLKQVDTESNMSIFSQESAKNRVSRVSQSGKITPVSRFMSSAFLT